MDSSGNEDFALEDEIQLSFEEITKKEILLKKIIEVTNFLFEKGSETQQKLELSEDNLNRMTIEKQEAMNNFHQVTAQLEQAANKIEDLERSNDNLQKKF